MLQWGRLELHAPMTIVPRPMPMPKPKQRQRMTRAVGSGLRARFPLFSCAMAGARRDHWCELCWCCIVCQQGPQPLQLQDG
jgi:hypothetical protein